MNYQENPRRALRVMLELEAERLMQFEAPELYFEPQCDTVVLPGRKLSLLDELVRRDLYEDDWARNQERLATWKVSRALWISKRSTELFEHYRVLSLKQPISLHRDFVPKSVRQWMQGELAKGAWKDAPMRVLFFLVLRDLQLEAAEHQESGPDALSRKLFERQLAPSGEVS